MGLFPLTSKHFGPSPKEDVKASRMTEDLGEKHFPYWYFLRGDNNKRNLKTNTRTAPQLSSTREVSAV